MSIAPAVEFGLGKMAIEAEGLDELDSKYRLNFGGGVQIDYYFNDQFTISSGMFVVQKGGKFEYKNFSSNLTMDADLKLVYLKWPVLIKFNLFFQNIPVKSYIYGGYFLGIELSTEYETVTTISGISVYNSGDIEDIESFDFGIAFGSGIEYNNIFFDIHYELGMKDIDKTNSTVKTRAIFFAVGYKFDL